MTEYMGCPPWPRNNGNRRAAARFSLETIQEAAVAQDRDRIDSGLNDRPLDETVAGTGPGIADDSLSPGEDEIPQAPTDEEVEEMAEKLGSPTAEKNTLPLEGE
ncbi:MAG TPA: hypothetical protein VN750_22310 [Steroidobacteraceae bacterium]|nr:hypothetical protein [Steroidobacteraceae bacterium]